ncbi:hypothetical protein ACOME3_009926 [Neoechinorhynchus agilis]
MKCYINTIEINDDEESVEIDSDNKGLSSERISAFMENRKLKIEKLADALPAVTNSSLTGKSMSFIGEKGIQWSGSVERGSVHTFDAFDLIGCRIVVYGIISNIGRLKNLIDCFVTIGVVNRSVVVSHCKNCEFSLTCQQLRIQGCENCMFRVHPQTKCTLEECGNINFSINVLKYEGMDEDLEFAKFETVDYSKRSEDVLKITDFSFPVPGAKSPSVTFL